MDKLLSICAQIFDRCTLPFGVVHARPGASGVPADFTYAYLNPAMAAMTDSTVDDLLGKDIFELWPEEDDTWFTYFSTTAVHGIPCDFEAVSPLLSEFLHVSLFPIKEGYCGFFIQDVTQWVGQAQTSLLNARAGIFFYDTRSRVVMLTPAACEVTGLQTEYISFVEFMQRLFRGADEDYARERMRSFRAGEEASLLFMGQVPDGRWLRISLGHMGSTDRFAFGLIEDITRLHEVEEKSANRTALLQQQKKALETALDLAEQGSRAKDAFLTNVSHDFRTPMNAISGFAGIALDNLDDPARVKDCLQKIRRSSDHLLDLVNEILDASRIQSGKLAITRQPLSMGQLADEVAGLFAGQAAERGLAFTVDVSGIQHDRVIADKMRLAQVLVNVVGNAFKFTPDDGRVTLTVTECERAVKGVGAFVFTVEDTGCGMSDELMGRIFEPFERSTSPFVSHTEGTGLGMTITKNLVELMGGTIQVESEVGAGSTFTISIPLELDADADADAPVEANANAAGLQQQRAATLSEKPDFTGCRALVADDDELSREVLTVALERVGFTVDAVADGQQAADRFAQAEEGSYDVVLLDMRMPRMGGEEAARAIRSMEHADSSPVSIFAVTADAFDDVLSRVEDAGMDGRITKPLDVPELLSTLRTKLGR